MMKKVLVFLFVMVLVIALLAGCGSARDGYYKGLIDSGVPEKEAAHSADIFERTGLIKGLSYQQAYELGVRTAKSLGY